MYCQYPALFQDKLFFVSDNTLWTVSKNGGRPQRLSERHSHLAWPIVHPSGQKVAFTAGKTPGIYIFHEETSYEELIFTTPQEPRLLGWLDDHYLLYASNLESPFGESTVYALHYQTGHQQKFAFGPCEFLSYGAYHSQGLHEGDCEEDWPQEALYNIKPKNSEKDCSKALCLTSLKPYPCVLQRGGYGFSSWRDYQGGLRGNLWIDKEGKGDFQQLLPHIQHNMIRPLLYKNRVYFASDHQGKVGNIFSCTAKGEDLQQHTHHEDYYVHHHQLSTQGEKEEKPCITYSQGGNLYVLDLETSRSEKVDIAHDGGIPESYTLKQDPKEKVHHVLPSSCGKFVASFVRGRLFFMTPHKGPVTQLGKTQGYRYSHGGWLSDGGFVALRDDGLQDIWEIYYPQQAFLNNNPEKTFIFSQDLGRILDIYPHQKEPWVMVQNHRHQLFLLKFPKKDTQEKPEVSFIDHSTHGPISHVSWSPCGAYGVYDVTKSLSGSSLMIYDVLQKTYHEILKPHYHHSQGFFEKEGRYLLCLSQRHLKVHWDDLHVNLACSAGNRPMVMTLKKNHFSPFDMVHYQYLRENPEDQETQEKQQVEPSGKEKVEAQDTKPQEIDKSVVQVSELEPVQNSSALSISLEKKEGLQEEGGESKGFGELENSGESRGSGEPRDFREPGELGESGESRDFRKPGELGESGEPVESGSGDKKPSLPSDNLPWSEVASTLMELLPLPEHSYGGFFQVDKETLGYITHGENGVLDVYGYSPLKEKERPLAKGIHSLTFSPNGEYVVLEKQGIFRLVKVDQLGQEGDDEQGGDPSFLDFHRLSLRTSLKWDFRHMVKEAWRLQKEFFHCKERTGPSWNHVLNKYLPLVEKISTYEELWAILLDMQGELRSSHAYVVLEKQKELFGSLGIDLIYDGFRQCYRLGSFVGDNCALNHPLKRPGVDLQCGDVLLSVEGYTIEKNTDISEHLKGKIGRGVTVVFGREQNLSSEESSIDLESQDAQNKREKTQENKEQQDKEQENKEQQNKEQQEKEHLHKEQQDKEQHFDTKGPLQEHYCPHGLWKESLETFSYVAFPVSQKKEKQWRYESWVQNNRSWVHSKTQERIGYVHIPDMDTYGYQEFLQGYLAEFNKEGLIIDARYNGGGNISYFILDMLQRRRLGYDHSRHYGTIPYPSYSSHGHYVFLINGATGSDGDIFAYCVKELGLGLTIGETTWGGTVGIMSIGQGLIGNIRTYQPAFPFTFLGEKRPTENFGVDPDIVVVNTPQDYALGKDSQLERALEEILKKCSSSEKVPDNTSPLVWTCP